MSRNKILIILAVIILALGVWVFIESRKSSSTNGDGTSEKGILGSLFPFGSGSKTPSTTIGGDGEEQPVPGDETPEIPSNSPFAQIAEKATAGFIVIVPPAEPVKKPADTEEVKTPEYPTVRYVESGTGYIFDADAKGKNLLKVSGTVIARTAQALFGDNGESVILRYVKTDNVTVATYLGRVVGTPIAMLAGTLKGDFLADNISDVAMSPDGKSFLFLQPTTDGSVGMTMKTDGTAKKQAFASQFSEWLLDWTAAGTTLTTKAAASVPGYAYSIASSGVMTKLLGDIRGLTTKVSPDGKNVLYSVSASGGIALHIRHLKDGTDVNTGLSTLPEKCAWTADSVTVYCGATPTLDSGSYPDAWYQGSAHFNDAIWQIASASGTTTQISDGEGHYLDITHMALDSKGRFLFFINKNDGSLWSFDRTPPAVAAPEPALPEVQ